MPAYKAPLNDIEFVLKDVFNAYELWSSMDATSDVTSDLVAAILSEGAKICETMLAPLNREGDEAGCQFNAGEVTTPKGFKEAYQTFAAGGWQGLGGNPAYGGQGLPKMLTVLFEEMVWASNSAFALYPSLSTGCSLALEAHASDEIKNTYLEKLYTGQWTGTMCLTESHAGTDLGIIKTRAVDNSDGSYSITGSKIFITGGEHDYVENIVHLVLAKLPDAPAGVKGISLFLVPKYTVNEAGDLGERNGATCGSIEHKMGIKAASTCVMNFDNAKGYLIGKLNEGMACMFTMMNYERLSIGIQGLGLGELAYQGALEYAKDRFQGRAATGVVNKDKAADSIIVHPDVRKNLLTIKANTEAGRAFAAYVAMNLDIAKYGDDEDARNKAAVLVQLLTPIAKAYLTDTGFENCVKGQTVFGGHGYIREWGMEQAVRDARIAQIYEGTNAIQALDLTGRKIVRNKGQYFAVFVQEVEEFIHSQSNKSAVHAETVESINALKEALELLKETTDWLINEAQQDPNAVGAAATDYLNLFGLTCYAYMWAKMVAVSAGKNDDFYRAKLLTAQFFISRILPQQASLKTAIFAGSSSMMSMEEALF